MESRISPIIVLGALLAGCAYASSPFPLHDARTRPVALGFGMYVTPDPEHNPIDPPERFTGYHVGLDYETLASERNSEVPVFAVCSGAVLYSGFAEGYGGLLTQRCNLQHEEVIVLYGHLDQTSMPPETTVLMPGDRIGILAPAGTVSSGGNRKHLHLGIHRGTEVDVRGYVQTAEELKNFLDPRLVLPRSATGRPVQKFHIPSAL